jgi:hypothetical protein
MSEKTSGFDRQENLYFAKHLLLKLFRFRKVYVIFAISMCVYLSTLLL